MITRRRFAAQVAASAFVAPAALAQPSPAQGWPSRFVRVVVPYASGGPTDAVVRTVADPLARAWGQQIVIENKGGAGTNIGAEAVARSDPDGYTLLVGSSALAMNRNLYRSLNYDAVVDFAPVALICSFPFFMCIPNSSPAKSVQEFIAYAKEQRGALTFATPAWARRTHTASCSSGRDRNAACALSRRRRLHRFIAGRTSSSPRRGARADKPGARGSPSPVPAQCRSRRCRPPPRPACRAEVSSWFAFFSPARTPPDIIRKISADTVAALADQAVKSRLEGLGYTVIGSTPEDLATHLRSDIDKWGPVIKDAGIRIDG